MIARLLLACAILGAGGLFAISMHRGRERIAGQNSRYTAMVFHFSSRLEAQAHAQKKAEEKLATIQEEAASSAQIPSDAGQPDQAATAAVIPPDPTRNGGWPAGAEYFYFPKKYLHQASFEVLDSQRLSDQAATVYNLSETERQDVDRAIGDLFGRFRGAEIEHMKEIDLPSEWTHGPFTSGIVYQIPGFASEVAAWRQELQQRLETTLGSERGELLGSALDLHLRHDWNDLGATDRTVGFVWHPESNGRESLWIANRDQRHGDGTFQRYLPGCASDAAFQHYAELFGVQLPTR